MGRNEVRTIDVEVFDMSERDIVLLASIAGMYGMVQ
jgi:hypothetical protein